MSDEGDRLYKIYIADAMLPGTRCLCDFHQGHWSSSTAKTNSAAKVPGVQLTGSGCLTPFAARPPGGSHTSIRLPDTTTRPPSERPPSVAKTGQNCARCNFKNDYACANQKDGSYVCFECRS